MTALLVAALSIFSGVDTYIGHTPATRVETGFCTTTYEQCNPPLYWEVPDWARCPEWWPTAQDAGLNREDMPTWDYIMHRESRCNPRARNPSGASGLVQMMPFWWTGRNAYGWVFDPYDPYQNLHHAGLLKQKSGWRPWCYDGVTGYC